MNNAPRVEMMLIVDNVIILVSLSPYHWYLVIHLKEMAKDIESTRGSAHWLKLGFSSSNLGSLLSRIALFKLGLLTYCQYTKFTLAV